MEIKTISFGGVNCYLITTATGFVLIDTGYAKHRADVRKSWKTRAARLRS